MRRGAGLRRRLERLEHHAPTADLRSPPETYGRIRRDAQESIRESLEVGEDPIYRIADDGDALTADGRAVENTGDFIRALDRSPAPFLCPNHRRTFRAARFRAWFSPPDGT